MQNRIFSIDSAKAVKAEEYGYLNAIHYLAPGQLSGFNMCPKASAGCLALCLGWFSGQASFVANLETGSNPVRASRVAKTQRFMTARPAYMVDLIKASQNVIARAKRMRRRIGGKRVTFKPCIRLNGSTDIAWEGIRIRPEWCAEFPQLAPYVGKNIFEIFPDCDFVDYTKIAHRFGRALPANYHLTFSRSETNEAECLDLLARGVNVAVVFAGDKPETWNGHSVIDGDLHDLRQLDPRGDLGCVIALSPKGVKARRDTSGFVVRQIAATCPTVIAQCEPRDLAWSTAA